MIITPVIYSLLGALAEFEFVVRKRQPSLSDLLFAGQPPFQNGKWSVASAVLNDEPETDPMTSQGIEALK